MHTDFYKLKEEPFSITPDPDFFYGSETHKTAFLSLVDGIQRRKGFMLLTGPVGSGKTMLSRSILPYLGDDYPSSMIIDPIVSPLELLLTILEDMNIPVESPTIKSCRDALNASLLKTAKAGSTSVLIIDEAQQLKIEVLEQIRLLSNFETNKAKLIQIILVGQPELNDLLAREELRQLRQRITVKYNIAPLSRQETREYIRHRIKVAGGADDLIFNTDAMDRIHDYSQGIPRVINVLCDHVLTKVEQEQTSEDYRSRIDLEDNHLKDQSQTAGTL